MAKGVRQTLVALGLVALVAGVVTSQLPVAPASAATGVPGPPSAVTAHALEGAATLTWSAPSSTGSSAITSYLITASPGSTTTTVPGTSLTATVGGLANGTAYTFTVAATNASGTGTPSPPSSRVTPSHPGGQYHPLTPYRICDTRAANPSDLTGTDAQCEGKTLAPGRTLVVKVAGTDPSGTTSGGVPTSGATAVVMNVTVTNTTEAGYLTAWPTDKTRPTASNLNWTPGDTVPNLVQVALGATGTVSFYNYAGTTDLIVDVEGYVAPAVTSTTGLYHALTPYRICDTRAGNPSGLSGTDAQCEGKTLAPGGTLVVKVAGTDPSGTTSGGVPTTGVSAVVLNVTVTDTTEAGYLTAWPTGATQPTASNLNWTPGETVPNRVVVPVSATGTVSFYNFSGSTDLIVDVDGYDSTGSTSTGSYFTGLTPARICDTRAGNPSTLTGTAAQCLGKTLGPGSTLDVQVAGVGGVPPETSSTPPVAVVLNVTVANTTEAGYLTAWPTGATQPTASDLNWSPGETVPNLVQVALGTTGKVSFYNFSGSTDLIVDVVGYESGTNVVPPTTVVLSPGTLSLLTTVATGQSSLTFTSTDTQLQALVPGDIVTAGATPGAPTGFMLLVTGVHQSGSKVVVTTTAASLTQVAPQGSFSLAGAPMNLLDPPTNLAPLFRGTPTKAPPAATPPPSNMRKFLKSVTCGVTATAPTITYTAGFTNFTVTPQFNATWHWGLPPSVSFSTSLRLDETYQASASIKGAGVSVSCSTSVPIPGLNNLILSDPIPIPIGPFSFTLTPVLQASVGVTATGTLTGTQTFSITQSAYAQAGVDYATGSFTPIGGTGCDPPVPSGTLLCTTPTASTTLGSSLSLSVGPSFSLVGAIDAIPGTCSLATHLCYVGGPVIGPELSLGLALTGTLQPKAPIWSVGVNLTVGVGFTANWSLGPITLNLTFQHDLVNKTLTLAHAVEVTTTTTTLPPADVGVPYVTTLNASGGTPPYHTWAFAKGSSPPSWLTLTSAGVLSGTPPYSAANTTVKLEVAVTDSSTPAVTATQTLTLTVGVPTLTITTASLPQAVTNQAYSATLQASGGIPPYTWAITTGTLPQGLSLTGTKGVISGTPTKTGSSTLTLKVTDKAGASTTKSFTLVVTVPSQLTGVVSLTSDGEGDCALLTSGDVDCWGLGKYGQLGNKTLKTSAVPVQVLGVGGTGLLTGVASLTSDESRGGYCALLTSGGVDCWGYGGYGTLGNGTFKTSAVPVQVLGVGGTGLLTGVASLTSYGLGYCALLTSGGVDCWGYGRYGTLGNGTFYATTATTHGGSAVPVQVVGVGGSGLLTDVASLTSDGGGHCALLTSGGVDCWGSDLYGQLGHNAFSQTSATPVPVSGVGESGTLGGVASLTSDTTGYCALLTSGGVDCWGYGAGGQLGSGAYGDSASPVAVEGVGGSGTLTGVESVSGSAGYYCAVLTSGGVDCWGLGEVGQLGNGIYLGSATPVAVEAVGGSGTLTGVESVAGDEGTGYCALLTSGGVDCWGLGEFGQLGNGTFYNTTIHSGSATPVAVEGVGGSGTLIGVRSVVGDGLGYCALLTSGGVDCWGVGEVGELGNGTFYTTTPDGSATPVIVKGSD